MIGLLWHNLCAVLEKFEVRCRNANKKYSSYRIIVCADDCGDDSKDYGVDYRYSK